MNEPGHPRLLFVCLGNICRSPAAEGMMRALADREGLADEIDSAGTGAWHIGEPPDHRMQAAARARGFDLGGLRARQAVAEDFTRFDLILAMDRDNLAALERLRPAGNRTPVHLLLSYGAAGAGDVPDPYYGGGFGRVLEMIEEAISRLVDALGHPSGG